jgi:hypothetical protein
MSAFSSDAFSTSAFSVTAFALPASGPVLPAPAVITARVQFAPALAVAAQCAPSITATVTVRP